MLGLSSVRYHWIPPKSMFFFLNRQMVSWLVVEPTPLKNDGVRQLGWLFHSQLNGKSFKFPLFQSPPRSFHSISSWICMDLLWQIMGYSVNRKGKSTKEVHRFHGTIQKVSIIQFCVTPPGDFHCFINLSNCAINPTLRLAVYQTQITKIHTLVKYQFASLVVKPPIFGDDFYWFLFVEAVFILDFGDSAFFKCAPCGRCCRVDLWATPSSGALRWW